MNDYDLEIIRLAGSGYCCAQIVIKLGLGLHGGDNPGLVKAVSGLCYGISGNGACGALSGAACLIGYFGCKNSDTARDNEKLLVMLEELYRWFESHATATYGGVCCHEITGGKEAEPSVCGTLVSDCFARAVSILQQHGIDFEVDDGA